MPLSSNPTLGRCSRDRKKQTTRYDPSLLQVSRPSPELPRDGRQLQRTQFAPLFVLPSRFPTQDKPLPSSGCQDDGPLGGRSVEDASWCLQGCHFFRCLSSRESTRLGCSRGFRCFVNLSLRSRAQRRREIVGGMMVWQQQYEGHGEWVRAPAVIDCTLGRVGIPSRTIRVRHHPTPPPPVPSSAWPGRSPSRSQSLFPSHRRWIRGSGWTTLWEKFKDGKHECPSSLKSRPTNRTALLHMFSRPQDRETWPWQLRADCSDHLNTK